MLFAWENIFSKLLFAFTGTLLQYPSSPASTSSPRKIGKHVAVQNEIDGTIGKVSENGNMKYVDVADPVLCVDVSPLLKVLGWGMGDGDRVGDMGMGGVGHCE